MALGNLTSQELHNLRDFATQWGKIIARRAFGEAGPPLDADLFTLEQAAQAAALVVLHISGVGWAGRRDWGIIAGVSER